MGVNVVNEYLMHAVYFAPRGKKRLLHLGDNIAQRYLSPEDKLIGFVGDAGAGKSLLIRGMFPGLELTNDDDGINIRPLPLLADVDRGGFRARSYHVDVRFEAAFTPLWQIAEAVVQAIKAGHRVVIEHFDMLYPVLNINAELLIGVGEEVIVLRPGVFGPYPKTIAKIVFKSLKYRKMAHTAEDLVARILAEQGIERPEVHSDIKHGFILEFEEKPDIDLEALEQRVLEYIKADSPVCYFDDHHIKIGEHVHVCTGPRLHMKRTGEIEGFHLLKEFKWDPIRELYVLAGLVGRKEDNPFERTYADWFSLVSEEQVKGVEEL